MNTTATAPVITGRYEWERRANERTGAGAVMDPYPRLAQLREQRGIHEGSLFDLFGVPDPMREVWPGIPRFTTVSFELTQQVLRDNATFTNEAIGKLTEKQFGRVSLMGSDDPEHRRYRALVQPAFGHRALGMWGKWLAPRLDELIDGFVERRRVDLYGEYCARFPVYVIAMALGVDVRDLGEFHEWAAKLQIAAAPLEETLEARAKVVAYLTRIIAARREQPQEDLISVLVASEIDEGQGRVRISDEQIIGLVCNLLPAGSGTTYRSLGIALVTLLQRPELVERLVRERALVRPVLEEVLRWNGPVLTAPPRLATRTVELDGLTVPKGAIIEPCIAAANRDPRQFERPEEFDPFRPMRPHLGFSAGPHFCLGAQVARLELEGALDRLLERLPGLRLDPSAPTPEITGLWYRMPTAVPAVWD
jgi:cytochrome P450